MKKKNDALKTKKLLINRPRKWLNYETRTNGIQYSIKYKIYFFAFTDWLATIYTITANLQFLFTVCRANGTGRNNSGGARGRER